MKLNKWLALILVFAMLSALIACGSDAKDEPTTEPTTTEAPTTTEEPTTEAPTTEPTTESTTEAPSELVIDSEIVGNWNFPLPCADLMEQSLLNAGVECDIADDMALLIKLTYNADGTYSMAADADSAKAMVDEMLRAMSGMMADLLYEEFTKQQGWDKATTDAQLAAQGLTMDSLVEQSLAQVDTSSLDFSTTITSKAFYIVEGNVFYTAASMEDLLAGKYVDSTEFVIDGDQMQFLSCELFNEDATSLEDLVAFPLTLTRD